MPRLTPQRPYFLVLAYCEIGYCVYSLRRCEEICFPPEYYQGHSPETILGSPAWWNSELTWDDLQMHEWGIIYREGVRGYLQKTDKVFFLGKMGASSEIPLLPILWELHGSCINGMNVHSTLYLLHILASHSWPLSYRGIHVNKDRRGEARSSWHDFLLTGLLMGHDNRPGLWWYPVA